MSLFNDKPLVTYNINLEEYPLPKVEKVEDYYVVRDDELPYGSKTRFADYLIGHSEEFKDKKEMVYGANNKVGWGAISIAFLCKKYGKKAVFFMAKRKEPTEHQKKVIDLGGIIHWVENGMLTVCQKRAKDYVAENPNERALLPMGLEHPAVNEAIVQISRHILKDVKFSEVWTVGSSGTLTRGLQKAFPDKDFHVVQIGHKMTTRESGRAKVYESPYKYDAPIKNDLPPYDSEIYYDAKVWPFVLKYAKKDALIWNVAGDIKNDDKK